MRDEIPLFLQNLPAAYQLRYHLGLATKRKLPFFKPPAAREAIESTLPEVCTRNNYHLLDYAVTANGLYVLLSLRPEHSVSNAVKSIRGNVWAAIKDLGDSQPVWARGIFARSVGSVNAETIAKYLASQFGHHHVNPSAFEPVSYEGNVSAMTALRKTAHAVFEMNHHFVFAVQRRESFLDPEVARGLLTCLRQAATAQDLIVWRIDIVPDHAHLLLGLKPSHVPSVVASRLLADSSKWLTDRYSAALRLEKLEEVWQQSYYVGSTGAATTAQVRASLRKWGVG